MSFVSSLETLMEQKECCGINWECDLVDGYKPSRSCLAGVTVKLLNPGYCSLEKYYNISLKYI